MEKTKVEKVAFFFFNQLGEPPRKKTSPRNTVKTNSGWVQLICYVRDHVYVVLKNSG